MATGGAVIIYCLDVGPYANFASTPLWVPRDQLIFTGFALLFGPLMVACEHLGPVTRLLETRPLGFTGRISNGLYLWHPLAFAAGRRLSERAGMAGAPTMALCIGLACAVAALSLFCFRRDFLPLEKRADCSDG